MTYLYKLERVRSLLALKPAELAKLVGVSREALRQWHGGAQISSERWADIDRLVSTVNRLASYFKPEALPSIVRRRAQALNQQTAFDWLASKRYDELLSQYEAALTYEATA